MIDLSDGKLTCDEANAYYRELAKVHKYALDARLPDMIPTLTTKLGELRKIQVEITTYINDCVHSDMISMEDSEMHYTDSYDAFIDKHALELIKDWDLDRCNLYLQRVDTKRASHTLYFHNAVTQLHSLLELLD